MNETAIPAEAEDRPLRVFCGTAHLALGHAIAKWLDCELSPLRIRHFADGEIHLSCDGSVRGTDAYIIQPTCHPVNDNLIELLICIDALRRASASHITAVVPYFGYARQEKKDLPREPITARLVADLLERAGANRVMAMDLHAGAIQGFFDVPVDHLTAANVLAAALQESRSSNMVVVSPDEGGVKLARRYAVALSAPLAVVYGHDNTTGLGVPQVAGDVRGVKPVIVEDMITTGASVLRACDALLARGCERAITIVATHGVFVGSALERVCEREEVLRVFVTDTVPQPLADQCPKLQVVSVASLFGEAIYRAHRHESISSLFAMQSGAQA